MSPAGSGGRGAAVLLVALLGCAPAGDGSGDGGGGAGHHAETSPPALRPGDGLLERLGQARLVRSSPGNLAPAVAGASREPFWKRIPPIPPSGWVAVETIPERWRRFLERRGELRLWRTRTAYPTLPGREPPRVLLDGEPIVPWDPFAEAWPGRTFAWWLADSGSVLAVSPDPPRGVGLETWVDPAREMGEVERGRVAGEVAGEGDPGGDGEREPAAGGAGTDDELVRRLDRFALGDQDRPGLLLPPPSRVVWGAQRLQATRLELAVGLIDRAWRVDEDGVVHRTTGRTDGARVAVEVRAVGPAAEGPAGGGTGDGPGPSGRETGPREAAPGGGPPAGGGAVSGGAGDGFVRVWSLELSAEDAGAGYREVAVDLADWAGRTVEIALVTEAPEGTTPHYDYVVWSGLRLRGGSVRRPDRPHVVLVLLDTLRADRLGVLGGERELTPRLDAWARRRATVFTDAVATSTWTLPSTASILTGLAVHQHGVDRATGAVGPRHPSLARVLSAAGYETRAVAAGGYLRPAFGFAAGFDVYASREPKDADWSAVLEHLRDRDSERPQFLLLHTYFVHAPYPWDDRFVPDGYDGPLAGLEVDYGNVIDPYEEGVLDLGPADFAVMEALYDALVARLDAHVGAFLEELETILAGEDLLVIVTSDHGEAFHEHGLLTHGGSLYDEMLAVPLLVRFPDGATGVRSEPVSTLDIVPTVLDVAGLGAPTWLPGRSLRDPTGDELVARVARAGTDVLHRAVLAGGYKLVEVTNTVAATDPEYELYHRATDAAESRDVAATEADRLRRLLRQLERFEEEHPPVDGGAGEATMDAEAIEQLRQLGYLGDG